MLRGLSVCKIRKRYTMIHKYMPPKIDFKILIALTLTMMGFLMSIATFSISYRAHQKAYPEAQTIVTDEQKINFIAVGDIMLSRLVARRAEIANNPYWMWENIDDFLKQSDFNF